MTDPTHFSTADASPVPTLGAGEVRCPACQGRGHNVAFWDGVKHGRRTGGVTSVRCSVCGGSGRLTETEAAQLAERQAEGATRRADRIARRVGLNDEARRLGIPAPDLAKMENGRMTFPDRENRDAR